MKIDYIKNYISNKYNNSSDLVKREIKIGNKKILYIYLESVSSDDKISDFFMKQIKNYKSINLFEALKNNIPNSHLIIEDNIDDAFYKLASGYTCIFTENSKNFISIETKSTLDRGINESSTESILRGPKDSFTENIVINLGLIRKRIKDYNLYFDELIIGRRTKSKIVISYINGITIKKNIIEIKNKLKNIDIDGILDSGYIRDFLNTKKNTFFPKIKSTERPDLVSQSLLDGKIVIMVENSPFALILPSTLFDFIISSEDYYEKSGNVNFTKTLRFLSFILTITIPGLYVAATTFNQEVIPDELLISITTQREGVPIPTILEVFMMITTFEILRESDIRLPSKMSSAISIVGALVLGEAAVSAGIVSPIVIIVVSITSICGLLFTDIDFVNAIRWWRFLFLFLAGLVGIVGIMIAGIIFINKLCSTEILDTPYLTPISPLYPKDIIDTLFKRPINKNKKRPSYLTNNTKKVGDL